MTKVDYIKMNRGINEQKDLPREYLEAIYDEIATNEIRMSGSSTVARTYIGKQYYIILMDQLRQKQNRLPLFIVILKKPDKLLFYVFTASEKQRRQAYNQEMAKVAETAKTLMENISEKSSTFTSATHVEHVRGMFKVHYILFTLAA